MSTGKMRLEQGEDDANDPCDRIVNGRIRFGPETRERYSEMKEKGDARAAQQELWKLQRAVGSLRECIVIVKAKITWLRTLITGAKLHDLRQQNSLRRFVFWLPDKRCRCQSVSVFADNESRARERLLEAGYGQVRWDVVTGDRHLRLLAVTEVDDPDWDGGELVGVSLEPPPDEDA